MVLLLLLLYILAIIQRLCHLHNVLSRPHVSDMALSKADGDDTVQWPRRRSASENEPVPADILTPSPHGAKTLQPHLWLWLWQPHLLAPPVNAVRPISDIFRQNAGWWWCRMTGCLLTCASWRLTSERSIPG